MTIIKFKVMEKISWLSSTVFATIVSVVFTGIINWATNKNDVSAKYVQMAVGILSVKPSGDKALREWAIEIINHYADAPLKISGDLKIRLINGEVNLVGFGLMSEEDDVMRAKVTVGGAK